MEFWGELLAGLAAIVGLAALGITTLAAFVIMAVLGFVTELSFKRLFFVSFGLGLLAPLLVIVGLASSINPDTVEQDLRAELRDALPPPEEFSRDLREAVPQIEDLQRDIREGNLQEGELEQRLEELLDGTSSVQIDNGGVSITTDGETVTVDTN